MNEPLVLKEANKIIEISFNNSFDNKANLDTNSDKIDSNQDKVKRI
jgi:hypothetical protein